MKDIIITGIQGSGKGTQSELLLKEFGNKVKYFEAGGILRALISKPNAIGDYVSGIMNKGDLLPDQFMVKVFDLFLFSMEEGISILVDGFPRQIPQMHGFLDRVRDYKRDIIMINLIISREEAVKRLTNRRLCKSCGAILSTQLHDCSKCPICGKQDIYQRIDDSDLAAINTRIDLFEDQTIPVIKHMDGLGLVKHVNGDQSIEKVFDDIRGLVI